MVDVVGLAIFVILALAVIQLISPWVHKAAERTSRARAPRTARAGGHDWDRRTDQLYRQVKGLGGPEEARDEILRFLDTHRGVEAYVEPRTVMHPLSVVLVDDAGTAKRFQLREDTLLRELAKTRGLAVLDATRVGYPARMRRGRPPEEGSGAADGDRRSRDDESPG
jgi:hypothetical protein